MKTLTLLMLAVALGGCQLTAADKSGPMAQAAAANELDGITLDNDKDIALADRRNVTGSNMGE